MIADVDYSFLLSRIKNTSSSSTSSKNGATSSGNASLHGSESTRVGRPPNWARRFKDDETRKLYGTKLGGFAAQSKYHRVVKKSSFQRDGISIMPSESSGENSSRSERGTTTEILKDELVDGGVIDRIKGYAAIDIAKRRKARKYGREAIHDCRLQGGRYSGLKLVKKGDLRR